MSRARVSLLVTLVCYLALQWLYIGATPRQDFYLPDSVPQAQREQPLNAGLGPDEKEYLLYVRSLAENGRAPQPLPRYRTRPEQYVCYQTQHPPLFFALSVPLWKALGGQSALFWSVWRWCCALCGLGVIVLGARALRAALPENPLVELAAAPTIAFVPMFGHMMGHVSNEPLAMLLGTWAWCRAVMHCRSGTVPTVKQAALLGLLLGLAALTRLTSVVWALAVGAALVLTFRKAALRSVLVVGAVMGLCLAPWLIDNIVHYGKPILRTFDNGLFKYGFTFSQYLSGVRPPDSPIAFLPMTTVIWFSATAWTPYWLIFRYLPGGPIALGSNAALLFLGDVAIVLALFWNASQSRRGLAGPRDTVLRALALSAGLAGGFTVLVLLQQLFFSDWDVQLSAGRYTVALTPAWALLLLIAVGGVVRKRSAAIQRGVGVGLAIVLLLADLYTVSLVKQFYTAFPSQPAWQRIAPEDSGKAYLLSDSPTSE